MITGTVTPDGIFIEAEVQVANRPTATPIRFLAHSGSAVTAIHPWDLAQMRLPAQILDGAPEVYITGVGGQAAYRALPSTVTFTRTYPDGTPASWNTPSPCTSPFLWTTTRPSHPSWAGTSCATGSTRLPQAPGRCDSYPKASQTLLRKHFQHTGHCPDACDEHRTEQASAGRPSRGALRQARTNSRGSQGPRP